MQLAKAFIELGFKGFDKVAGMMQRAAQEVERGMGPINQLFVQARDNILDFTRSGSPLAFNTFTQSIEHLKATIGTSFSESVMQVSKSIQDLSKWIKGLDPETKKVIAQWTVAGTVGLALVVVLGKIAASLILLGKAAYALVANPAVLAITTIGAAAVYAWHQLSKLEEKADSIIEKNNRLRGGNVNEDDIAKSGVGKLLMREEDPEKRKQKAEMFLENLKQQRQQLRDEANEEGAFERGWNTLFSNKEKKRLDKLGKLADEQRIAEHFLKAGDKMPEIKKAPAEAKVPGMAMGSLLGGMGAMSGAGVMGLESAYGRTQGMALGQSQLQQLILEEQRKGNMEAAKSAQKIEGIHTILGRLIGL